MTYSTEQAWLMNINIINHASSRNISLSANQLGLLEKRHVAN